MKETPDKFQAICIGQKTHDNIVSFQIGQTTIFLIKFNVPFKIISLIETSKSIGGAKREYLGKTT